jgi:hypothetical protein
MKKILVMGKGEAFTSMVHYLSLKNVKESVTIVPYDDRNDLMDKSILEPEKLKEFERVYFFPERTEEGKLFTTNFSKVLNAKLFVVTEDFYSDVSNDFVVISNS